MKTGFLDTGLRSSSNYFYFVFCVSLLRHDALSTSPVHEYIELKTLYCCICALSITYVHIDMNVLKQKSDPIFFGMLPETYFCLFGLRRSYIWQSEVAIIIDTNTFNNIRKCVH